MHTRALLRFAIPALLLVLRSSCACWAQSTQDAISARLKGQPLYLTGCWGGEKLSFQADGQPKKHYRVVPFTEAGMEVRRVELSGDRLRIEGPRIGLLFTEGKAHRVPIGPETITIEIQGVAGEGFGKALDAIFAPDLARLVPTMPDYWQDYARKYLVPPSAVELQNPTSRSGYGQIDAPVPQDLKPMHVGGSIKPPVLLSGPEPEFNEASKLLKMSGTVEVYMWIPEDGLPTHIRLVRPMGMGLDEEAIQVVTRYRFKPAMKDGKPLKVDLYIDVGFHVL